jgi:hypothetical protein
MSRFLFFLTTVLCLLAAIDSAKPKRKTVRENDSAHLSPNAWLLQLQVATEVEHWGGHITMRLAQKVATIRKGTFPFLLQKHRGVAILAVVYCRRDTKFFLYQNT